MHKVNAEGTIFFYLANSEPLVEVASCGLTVPMPDASVADKIRRLADVRLVVFERMLRRGEGAVYYLYWRVGRDLEVVDQQVLNGTHTDDDFIDSVKTVYQVTFCDRCGSHWHTLIIPSGDPYPGAPGLLQHKIESSSFDPCPKCSASLRRMVVKILGPADPDDRRTAGRDP
jgi:hypothetical protein